MNTDKVRDAFDRATALLIRVHPCSSVVSNNPSATNDPIEATAARIVQASAGASSARSVGLSPVTTWAMMGDAAAGFLSSDLYDWRQI
jgi:hypothetical protein